LATTLIISAATLRLVMVLFFYFLFIKIFGRDINIFVKKKKKEKKENGVINLFFIFF
jgi:hypothetical protein